MSVLLLHPNVTIGNTDGPGITVNIVPAVITITVLVDVVGVNVPFVVEFKCQSASHNWSGFASLKVEAVFAAKFAS